MHYQIWSEPGSPPVHEIDLGNVPAAGFTRDATVLVRPLFASGFRECPPPLTLLFLWDEQFGVRITDAGSTSSRVALIRSVEELPGSAQALDDLGRWTSLGAERVAYMLGASRRSLYNWRRAGRISGDAQARVTRVHDLLRPLSTRLAPALLGEWLDNGEPSALQLAHDQDWPGLEERVAAAVARPAKARPVEPTYSTTAGPEAFDADTRSVLLERFTNGRDLAPRRAHWSPRELTGSGDEELDDD